MDEELVFCLIHWFMKFRSIQCSAFIHLQLNVQTILFFSGFNMNMRILFMLLSPFQSENRLFFNFALNRVRPKKILRESFACSCSGNSSFDTGDAPGRVDGMLMGKSDVGVVRIERSTVGERFELVGQQGMSGCRFRGTRRIIIHISANFDVIAVDLLKCRHTLTANYIYSQKYQYTIQLRPVQPATRICCLRADFDAIGENMKGQVMKKLVMLWWQVQLEEVGVIIIYNICSKPPMNRMNYAQAATQIHNLTVYNQLYEQMGDFQVLDQIFGNQCQKSPALLFAACQILSKKLLNRQLLTTSEDLEVRVDNNSLEVKKITLFNIASKLHLILGNNANTNNLPPYIVRSCINTISLCIHSTILTSSGFDSIFINYLKLLAPDFHPNELFAKPVESMLVIIDPSPTLLGLHHQYAIKVLASILDYIVNSTYFENYYYFRRNLYAFRNHYLVYYLNYSIFTLKSIFKQAMANSGGSAIGASPAIRPALKLFQQIVTYPFSLNMHESEIEDEIHENISGLQSEIYFPSYFRNLLCDTGFLMDLIGYYVKLNNQAIKLDPIRDDIYSLIRIIGRILSTSQYVFMGQSEKKGFRTLSLEFVTRILKQNRFFDTYLILCITKINVKFMSIQNEVEMFQSKRQYFNALTKFILTAMTLCEGKIEDGDKHPFRQIFQILTAYVNITANTVLDKDSKLCAQEALTILFRVRLVNNEETNRMMKQFGYKNGQQIDCFAQMFARIPQIFKINLPVNLTILHQLDLSALNGESLTFWLHLTALLLPEHDTSIQQTQLIIKFLEAAIAARSIASLHYIQTLMKEILYQLKDGISTTYLWKFIQESKKIKFDQFLSYIIEYAMKILTEPNYVLIENCLELFTIMFTKLCKHRHRSFIKYFEIIQQVCQEIDKTMLVHPDYTKLRINFFSIISIIWVSEGQVNFVYRIFRNIRQNLRDHADFMHFMRYLTDVTGLIQPVQSSDVFKLLVQLLLVDLAEILPYYFGTPQKLNAAFSEEIFLKTFIKFVLTLVNDHGFRMSHDSHTQLPFQIQQTFRPYLIQALKYDYPQKMVDLWIKFIKLNPMGALLPLEKSFKQKNSPHYRSLIREYFENLHRISTVQQFLYMYSFIDGNIDLMVDWWQEVMVKDIKPEINVREVVNARIWTNLRQKEQLAKLLYRISRYDERYWKIECEARTQSKYAEWFMINYK